MAPDPEVTNTAIIAVDPRYFRPTEVETLLGDATKAREELSWVPQTSGRQSVMRSCANMASARSIIMSDHTSIYSL